MKTKTCTKCCTEKTVDQFTRLKKGSTEFSPMCRSCQQHVHRAWRTQLGRERYTPETAP